MKYAYLTCELVGRDLDSRLLIAAHLLKRGVSCIVGQQWGMMANVGASPKGVFLFKTANRVQGVNAVACNQCGHQVVMSDEEVLSMNNADLVLRGTDLSAVQAAHLFLALDERHKSVIQSVAPVRCEVVGNARIDLLLTYPQIYRAEADQIKANGPYILFNTGFTLINSLWGPPEVAVGAMLNSLGMDPQQPEAAAFAREALDFECANRDAMLEILRWAYGRFNRRIVVRPHPAENAATWAEIAGVEMFSKTSPVPWLLGTDLLVHTSSTTGLEGALLGTPCLNLVPVQNPAYAGSFHTQTVNYTTASVDEAKAAMAAFLNESAGPIAEQKKPAQFLGGGAERTAKLLEELAPEAEYLSTWARYEGTATQSEKFDISPEAFSQRASSVLGAVGVKTARVVQLDRALFWLSP